MIMLCRDETVSKVDFNPQTPQGGLYRSLFFNKSPLGDLGVDLRIQTFDTASSPSIQKMIIIIQSDCFLYKFAIIN